jgi:nitrate/nitrite transporter NarK
MGGLIAAAIFLAVAAHVSDNSVSLVALALSFGCSDLILAVCWATCLDIGRDRAGLVSGTMNSLGQLGAVAAPVAIGWLVDTFGSWEIPLLISAGYYLVSAMAWMWIDAEQPIAA